MVEHSIPALEVVVVSITIYLQFFLLKTVRSCARVFIGVRANIHLGGQTEFCPNGERKLFVTRPRQGEKNNNELLQSPFFDGRRVVPDERLLCYPTRNVSQQTTRLIKHVLCFARIMSTLCPN